MREVLLAELFRPLLPSTFDIMTGVLVDHRGGSALHQSGQEDILVYSREVLPGGVLLGEIGLLPVEACVAVIEVKSTLTAAGVSQAVEHAARIKQLGTAYEKSKRWPLSWPESAGVHPSYNLFALKSDLSRGSEWDRFMAAHRQLGLQESVIQAACVVGAGTAIWHGQVPPLEPKHTQEALTDLSEVIAFVSWVSDMARRTRQVKIEDLPFAAYSHYLLP